jgi:prepilin signal peptidase PulO-like enzyme (type II secretory pathway)
MLLQLFQDYPYLWLTSTVLLSLLVGSFLNVVILRFDPNRNTADCLGLGISARLDRHSH